jgi:hypothetical protein
MRTVCVASLLALSLHAYAENIYVPSNNNQDTLDVIVINNSNHTLSFQNSNSPQGSSCVVLKNPVIAPNQYTLIRGTFTPGNQVLSCQLNYLADNNQAIQFNILDPSYDYQGGATYRFYDGGTVISDSYTPSIYPISSTALLMDSSVTVILNNF